MVGGLIIVPIVSLFTAKPDKEMIDDIFSCYEVKYTAEITAKERIEEKK